jgi:hypothetical protein
MKRPSIIIIPFLPTNINGWAHRIAFLAQVIVGKAFLAQVIDVEDIFTNFAKLNTAADILGRVNYFTIATALCLLWIAFALAAPIDIHVVFFIAAAPNKSTLRVDLAIAAEIRAERVKSTAHTTIVRLSATSLGCTVSDGKVVISPSIRILAAKLIDVGYECGFTIDICGITEHIIDITVRTAAAFGFEVEDGGRACTAVNAAATVSENVREAVGYITGFVSGITRKNIISIAASKCIWLPRNAEWWDSS